MLLYPIEAAQRSGLFDLIVVSTDDAQIAHVAFSAGVMVLPRPFDDGTTGTQEIAGRVLDQLQYAGGEACVIYPTSPLLRVEDLQAGHQALLDVKNCTKHFVRAVGPDGNDAGALYVGWVKAFRDRKPLDADHTADLVLPAERVCDINLPCDWENAGRMYDAIYGRHLENN